MPRQSNANLGIPTANRWNARLYPRHKEMLKDLANLANTDMCTLFRNMIEEKAKAQGIFIPATFSEGGK